MLTLLRWLMRLFLGVVGAAVLAGLVAYLFLARSLPDYDEDFRLADVRGPLEIVRTTQDVPHVFAADDRDVFFGLGFAHAQDRLWQMTLLRRAAQGRLSEIFGGRMLEADHALRAMDLYGAALASAEMQDPATRDVLTAYAAGVNAWLDQVNRGARGRGAPEFFIFPPEVAVWQPADSIAILKLMALQFSSHLDDEVLRARLARVLPEARLIDLLPDDPLPAVQSVTDYAALFPTLAPDPGRVGTQTAWLTPRAPFGGASNAWAATGARAVTGAALLANDPHGPLSAPGMWYLARLDLASGGVIGATIPGVPLVLSGRSDRLAWGITAAGIDDQDVLIEKLNPENPDEYLTDTGWQPFETRRSIINVARGVPVTVDVRRSRTGPVLPPDFAAVGTITPPGHVAVLQATFLARDDTSIAAGLALMRAGTIEEGIAAGAGLVAPALNLVLAQARRIGMATLGRLPQRDSAHQTEGRMPAPGWLAANRWQGALPFSANPQLIDPPSGVLGNTNNRPVTRDFPDHLSHRWGDTQRIQRWARLMQAREVHTRDSFVEAQTDTVSPAARSLLPLVAADLWFSSDPAPEGTPERRRAEALARLAEWNGEMNEHLPEPLIFTAWMRSLQDALIRDELGPLAGLITHPEPVFIDRVFRDVGGAGVWCDVIQSSPRETCTQIARRALDLALIDLTEAYGPQVDSWRWGDAHQARHDHQGLGQVPVLRHLVNIRQSTSGGDFTLMRGLTAGTGPEPFANIHAAGYRAVYDFADAEASVFIIATGQSGHPLSRNYDNLGVLWRRGEYIPMTLDPDLARAGAVGITRIDPLANR